jgi:RES domain-containing protein
VSGLVLWRLCPAYYADKAMSGEGAFRRGGRWNPVSCRVIYCAESRSLAVVEILVNAKERSFLGEQRWIFVSVEVPDPLIEKPARVPDSWQDTPYNVATQDFGATWVREQRSAVLRVPSVVVLGEFNYLLNPAHPDFAKLRPGKPEAFSFDPRLSR